MGITWKSGVFLAASIAFVGSVGCDDAAEKAKIDAELKDLCPGFVAKVKAQCGDDSAAYKKQLSLDKTPASETEEARVQRKVQRIISCKIGLESANEKLDYTTKPDFVVGKDDPELQKHASDAEKNWETRKAAYEKMTPEDKKKDEDIQLKARCQFWILG